MRSLPQSVKSVARRQLSNLRYRYRVYETATLSEAVRYNPLGLITVSPSEIDRMMIPGEELYRKHTPGSVVGGNWDRQTKPFNESIYYRSLKRRLIDGDPWEQTSLYQSAVDRDSDNYYHGCATPEEVRDRLTHLETIYESMKTEGYLSQRTLRRQRNSSNTSPPELDEIHINIDREGKPIFDDGRHRLAMAKILDIKRVPAIVIGRHRDWWERGGQLSDFST